MQEQYVQHVILRSDFRCLCLWQLGTAVFFPALAVLEFNHSKSFLSHVIRLYCVCVSRDRAGKRITNYLSATKKYVDGCAKNKDIPDEVNRILEAARKALAAKLKHRDCNNFEGYFDRTSIHSVCDKNGYFICQGICNQSGCVYNSVINPYSSLKERLHFSSWEFDHR